MVTHCPLCEIPVGSSDELQLHYLTTCSGYDKVSGEQPRSKISSHRESLGVGAEQPRSKISSHRESLGVGDEQPRSKISSHRESSGVGIEQPRSKFSYGDIGGVVTDVRGEGEIGEGVYGGDEGFLIEHTTSTDDSQPPAINERSVQFMWQPMTHHINCPSVTLLASFQRGSVELNLDPEGGHYSSQFVNIPKGVYEGQLVVGDNFIHPVKEFSIKDDDDIIVLQFNITGDYGGSYDMQTNPSYFSPTHSEAVRQVSVVSYSNPMFSDTYGNLGNLGNLAYNKYYNTTAMGNRPFQSTTGERRSKSYSDTGATSESFRTGNAESWYSSVLPSDVRSPSDHEPGYSASNKLLEARLTEREQYSPQGIVKTPTPLSVNTSRYSDSAPHANQQQSSEVGEGEDDPKVQLQELIRERDSLKMNLERVNAHWQSQVKRLEQQLANLSGESEETREASNPATDQKKEIDELKDHNTALQEQLREYQHSIHEQHKYIQSISDVGSEAKQLLDFTKKQQLEHVESFSAMKEKFENAMKMHEKYIEVSQANIRLTGELEEYKTQTKLLIDDINVRDGEIRKLRESLSKNNSDRSVLELETMREKVRGWSEEVNRLLPLEEEVDKLRKENEDLSKQITLIVEEGERDQSRHAGKNTMDYDALIDRMTQLQETRVAMEGEIAQLREERANILQENAVLREGSQPQLYANLKSKYESVFKQLREKELALSEEKKLNHELHSANLEFQQKLNQAFDSEALKSIQERLDRYKKERDMARAEVEDREAKLAMAEVEKQCAKDALAKYPDEANEMLQRKIKSLGNEISRLQEECNKYEYRMRAYREERNKFKQQLRHYKEAHIPDQQEAFMTPSLVGTETTERESSHSPSHERQYGSPVLEYAPDHYTSEAHYMQHHRDSDSPLDKPRSPNLRYLTSSSSEELKKHGSYFPTVEVRTKNGVVSMDITRPSAKLTAKDKPQVVVKRNDVYETGTLMFLGTINGKELAGVCMDIRMERTASNNYDGTYKDGKRYFKCGNGFGLYVPQSKIFIALESATV